MLLTKTHNVVTTNNDGSVGWEKFTFTGSFGNISHYADLCFNSDKDQDLAFTQIVSAFVLKLHQKAKSCMGLGNTDFIDQIHMLKSKLNNPHQFICFLSGQGGSGKSKVIGVVLHCCKNLCQALSVELSRHTIVVTALTGAAAVNINGETTSRVCKLNKCKKKWQLSGV